MRFDNYVRDYGGGIYARYSDRLIIRDNEIRSNRAEIGAGIHCTDCSVEVAGNRIVHNVAEDVEANGGGAGGMSVFNEDPRTVLIKNNLIAYNLTEPCNRNCYAGGIWIWSPGTVEISGNCFLENRASFGGGMRIGGSRAVIFHNLFVGNRATGDRTDHYFSGEGGAIWQQWTSGPDLVWGNTFYDNEATNLEMFGGGDPDGAIYSDGLMDISNNIIVKNTGGGIHIYEGHEPYLIRCNDVWGNTFADYHGGACPGEGDISKDPQLDEMGECSYTLKPTSPCIDAGIDLGYEYFGKAPDMGSWEYDYEGPLPRLKEWFRLEMEEEVPDSVQ